MAEKLPNPIDKHVGSRVRMRRMMLKMSQEKLADGLGLTFQQVQKYEKGSNRIGASTSPDYVTDFLDTADGLALTKAFMRIKNAKLRRCIVGLVEQITVDNAH